MNENELPDQPSIIRPGCVRVRYPFNRYYPIISPFGVLRDLVINGQKISRIHNGIDWACPEETDIYAVATGSVFRAGFENPEDENQGYGYRIWQDAVIDGQDFSFWYAHLAWSMVHDGFIVDEGEYIALSGNTGAVVRKPPGLGFHLHLSCREKKTNKFYDLEFYRVPDEPKPEVERA